MKPKVTQELADTALALYKAEIPVRKAIKILGISHATYYNLKDAGFRVDEYLAMSRDRQAIQAMKKRGPKDHTPVQENDFATEPERDVLAELTEQVKDLSEKIDQLLSLKKVRSTRGHLFYRAKEKE